MIKINKNSIIVEKGITLVALVITIIILLILTGVTLNTALSDNGLFQKAKYAGEKYKESEEQEQSALEGIAEEMDKISIDYNDYVGAYVDYKPTTGTCKISPETSGVHESDKSTNNNIEENLEQIFTTDTNMKWKIWDYDKYTKTVRLISAKSTTEALTLRGANGYNNGVWAVNEICRKCYGTDNRRNNSSKFKKDGYTKSKHI